MRREGFMAAQKRQHYVPKLYLRFFTVDNKLLSIYNISQKKIVSQVPYETQCYNDYYYGKDKLWENELSFLESRWGVVFQRIQEKKNVLDDDLYAIKQFALYQLQRTVAINNYLLHQREEFLCEYGRLIYYKNGLVFDSDADEYCKERAKHDCSPAETLAFANKYLPLIQDLELTIITYHTNQNLISSDVPVIAINPFHQPSTGYGCMGLIILFPISSNTLIVLYDAKMYPKYKGKQYVDCFDENEVSNLNILQLISAEKILVAKSEVSFSFISENGLEARDRNRNQKAVTFLGTDDNRLMLSEPRKVIYKCSFSFGEEQHRFKRIPFVCKEAPPRKWDSEWEKKLDVKEQILPTIIASFPNLSSEYGLSKKEIRKGCQRMATAAKVYWTQER